MDQPPALTRAARTDDTAFFGHPRGLSTLFFTEMWERFSYYGMRAILVLYMIAKPEAGGLGYSDKLGGLVYGMYAGMVYVLALPGGWIADRFIGQRRAVLVGGVLIMAGHICLAVPLAPTFFIGLILVALGTGFLKPNVAAIVGQIYKSEDERRDSAFSIYYMGINVGALAGPLIVDFLAEHPIFRDWLAKLGIPQESAWHFGFAAAAVGMFFGLVQFYFGSRRLGEAGLRPTEPKDATEAAQNRRNLIYIIAGIFGFPALVGALGAAGVIELTQDRVNYGSLVVLLAVAAGFFVAMFTRAKWTSEERRRIVAVLALFVGATFFFSVYEQAGSTFTVFAERSTINRVFGYAFPPGWWQSLNSLFIVFLLGPGFAALWKWLGRRHKDPPWPVKFGLGLILVAAGCLIMLPAAHTAASGGKAGPGFLFTLYFIHTCGEMCLSPVGLSATSTVAPKQIQGLAMGVFYMGIGLGNYLSGMYLGWTEALPLAKLFVVMALPPIAAGIIFFALVRPLRRYSQS